jgi:hypothetical protein
VFRNTGLLSFGTVEGILLLLDQGENFPIAGKCDRLILAKLLRSGFFSFIII